MPFGCERPDTREMRPCFRRLHTATGPLGVDAAVFLLRETDEIGRLVVERVEIGMVDDAAVRYPAVFRLPDFLMQAADTT